MMYRDEADSLAATLEPLLPDFEVTAVPWHNEGPRDEHIVTVWEDGEALLDIFGVGPGPAQTFVARRLGRGAEIFRATDALAIATAIREGAR